MKTIKISYIIILGIWRIWRDLSSPVRHNDWSSLSDNELYDLNADAGQPDLSANLNLTFNSSVNASNAHISVLSDPASDRELSDFNLSVLNELIDI